MKKRRRKEEKKPLWSTYSFGVICILAHQVVVYDIKLCVTSDSYSYLFIFIFIID